MQPTISKAPFVEYSTIFDDAPKGLDYYLKGISRATLIQFTIFFLSFSQRRSKFGAQKDFLRMFFSEANNDFANKVYGKLRRNSQEESPIIHPLTALLLLEYAFDNLDEIVTQHPDEIERNVFLAIISTNTAIGKKQEDGMKAIEHMADEYRLPLIVLCLTFSNSEFVNYDEAELIATQFIKSVYFFEFLETNPKTQAHLAELLSMFKCDSWKEYLKRLFGFVLAAFQSPQDIHTDVQIPNDADYQATVAFIDNLDINDLSVLTDYDFKQVRSQPFYKISADTYRIIFKLFVYELLHKGVYFKIASINNVLKAPERISAFRGFYCDEFSEKFVLYKTLNYIYGKRYKAFTGEEIKKGWGMDAEPDYYVRNGKYAFLYESKDVLVSAEANASMDSERYLEEFKKKFYYDDSKGKIENKAVLQLCYNIGRLLNSEMDFDKAYKPTLLHIYPILTLHDHQFNVAGLNRLINVWFKSEIIKLRDSGRNVEKVKPLVIINIDSLLFYQDTFQTNPSLLKEALDAYIKYTTVDPNRKYRSVEQAEAHHEATLLPFAKFLPDFIKGSKHFKKPKILLESGVKLF